MSWSTRGLPSALVALALVGVSWGCSPQSAGPGPGESTTPAASKARPSGVSAPNEKVTKLLIVVEENSSLAQMRSGMPYTFSLAKRFGYATNYYALTHPSLPNYVGMASGQTYGIADDASPSAHQLPGRTVFGQALAQGRTAGVYAEAMTARCATDNEGDYAVKHNAWAYFPDERSSCLSHDVPVGDLWADVEKGRLPNVGLVVPDLCHDAHDCDLSVADRWMESLMGKVFAGPDWKSGRLAVVVTADEDDHSAGNKVLTVVVHPSQRHHVVTERLDHYSLTRLYEDVVHAPYLAHARTAASMSDAFGLPLN